MKIRLVDFKEIFYVLLLMLCGSLFGFYNNDQGLIFFSLICGSVVVLISFFQFLLYYINYRGIKLEKISAKSITLKVNGKVKTIELTEVKKVEIIYGRKEVESGLMSFPFSRPYYFNFILEHEKVRLSCLHIGYTHPILSQLMLESRVVFFAVMLPYGLSLFPTKR